MRQRTTTSGGCVRRLGSAFAAPADAIASRRASAIRPQRGQILRRQVPGDLQRAELGLELHKLS